MAAGLVATVRAFHAAHRGVDLSRREMGPADQCDALRAGQLEAGYSLVLIGRRQADAATQRYLDQLAA